MQTHGKDVLIYCDSDEGPIGFGAQEIRVALGEREEHVLSRWGRCSSKCKSTT